MYLPLVIHTIAIAIVDRSEPTIYLADDGVRGTVPFDLPRLLGDGKREGISE
jgi:hypothetical protein